LRPRRLTVGLTGIAVRDFIEGDKFAHTLKQIANQFDDKVAP